MIVIIVPKNLSPGIVSSQIISFAEHLAKHKKVSLILNNHFRSKLPLNKLGITIIDSADKKKKSSVLKDAGWVYTRDPLSFLKYYVRRQMSKYSYNLFYDARGLVYEESYLKNKKIINRTVLYYLQKFAVHKADQLGTVSTNFSEVLRDKLGTTVPIHVTPCCISSVHQKEFVKKNEIKFVYVGGLSPWQCFDDILKLYKQIAEQFEKTSLTVITRQIDSARRKIDCFTLDNVTVKSLPQEEVPSHLPQYDFGFLVRENILLNNVASPVKFLEYTSNGVIPIITEGIGDFSQEVIKNNIGIVLSHPELSLREDQLLNLMNDHEVHNRLAQYSKHYLWDHYIEKHPLVH